MNILTTSELEENFEQVIERVETGESFLINHNGYNLMLIPYNEYREMDELTRIYTDHEEGC